MWNDAKDYEVCSLSLRPLTTEHDSRDVADSRCPRAIQQYGPVPQGKETGQGRPRPLTRCDYLVAKHPSCGQAGASDRCHPARYDTPARASTRLCYGYHSSSTIRVASGCPNASPELYGFSQVQRDARRACCRGSGYG